MAKHTVRTGDRLYDVASGLVQTVQRITKVTLNDGKTRTRVELTTPGQPGYVSTPWGVLLTEIKSGAFRNLGA